MVESAAVVLFVLRRADEDMPVPFVGEIPHVRDGNVDTLVFRALDERRKAEAIFPHVDELPMDFFAMRTPLIQVLRLKRFVILAGVAASRKFVGKVLFVFGILSHNFHPP